MNTGHDICSMKELLSLLSNIQHLSPALRRYLSEKINSGQVARKGYLLQAGNVCRQVWFIKKGLLRCYYLSGGREVCTKFIKEGDIIVSAASFFLQKESVEFIQAIEESWLYSICFDELQYIHKNFLEFNTISRVLAVKSYLLSEQRLRLIRMKQALDRYQDMLKHSPELVLRVPAKYLASYLDMSEETMSRVRSRKY